MIKNYFLVIFFILCLNQYINCINVEIQVFNKGNQISQCILENSFSKIDNGCINCKIESLNKGTFSVICSDLQATKVCCSIK